MGTVGFTGFSRGPFTLYQSYFEHQPGADIFRRRTITYENADHFTSGSSEVFHMVHILVRRFASVLAGSSQKLSWDIFFSPTGMICNK